MRDSESTSWPQLITFGEALTDLVRQGPDQWRSVSGGAALNLALAAAALGLRSACGAAVSCDTFGQALWASSAQAGLDMRFMQQNAHEPLLAVVHQLQPPRYFFVGADAADLHFRPEELPAGWLVSGAVPWAVFGGISLAREPLAARLLSLAEQARAAGVGIAYDANIRRGLEAAQAAALQRLLPLADVIKLSDEDAVALWGSVEAALLALRAIARPQAWLLLTRGAGTASLWHGAQCWEQQPPSIEVVDTVGAGDASLAGLLLSLIEAPQADGLRHLQHAVAAGAAACLGGGATAPTRAQLDAQLKCLLASSSPPVA
jgi:fructokinase